MLDMAALSKLLAKPLIAESVPLLKKIKGRTAHLFNDGISDYLLTSFSKYREIKTLLHRQPTNFYDIYYPAKLAYEKDILEIDSVKGLFQSNNYITILGDAGSGKSTLIKHLFIMSFFENFKTPIFIPLRDLDLENSNLETYLRQVILKNKLSPDDEHLTKLLNKGDFLFFLDGYDEIKSINKQEITTKLETFIDTYPNNNFILTSRPYSHIEYFKNFHNYKILDLNLEDRKLFIAQQIPDKKLSDKIIESIVESNGHYIESFFKNPLLLTLYIITYSKNSSIPKQKYIFYRRVFDVLYAEHDSATKIGFEREIKTQLSQEIIEKILEVFSFLSYFENNVDFNKDYISSQLNTIKTKRVDLKFRNNDFIDDMKLSIGLWIEDSGIYSFAHRSMQEYFAALFVSTTSDDTNKKSVYSKIINYACDYNFDLNNFLSLCYEMDNHSYIKYYALPSLKNLKKLFIDDKGQINYSFPYITNEFKYQENGSIGFTHTAVTQQTRQIIIPFQKQISIVFKLIRHIVNNRDHMNFSKFITTREDKSVEKGFVCFLPTKVSKEYIQFLEEIGIDKIINTFVQSLDEEIHKLEEQISKQKVMECDFITMI